MLQEGADDGHCCLEVLGALNTFVKDIDILLSIFIKLLLHRLCVQKSSNPYLLECSLDCQSVQHIAFYYDLLEISSRASA